MANFVNDLSLILYPFANTFTPQQISSSTNGTAVLVTSVGADRINAQLQTGAAVGLTSLDVKMQASPDGSTGWVDITDQGVVEAFNTVTTGNATPQIIDFQLPPPSSFTSPQYKYVRAVATLVGTSIYLSVSILGSSKYGGNVSGYQNQPPVVS